MYLRKEEGKVNFITKNNNQGKIWCTLNNRMRKIMECERIWLQFFGLLNLGKGRSWVRVQVEYAGAAWVESTLSFSCSLFRFLSLSPLSLQSLILHLFSVLRLPLSFCLFVCPFRLCLCLSVRPSLTSVCNVPRLYEVESNVWFFLVQWDWNRNKTFLYVTWPTVNFGSRVVNWWAECSITNKI